VIGILLTRVRYKRAIVHAVHDPVAVGIGSVVAQSVAVGIRLFGVGRQGTIVDRIQDAIAVSIVVAA